MIKFTKKEQAKLTTKTPLTFGKYKGTILRDAPEWYLAWCYNNIDWFKANLDKNAKAFFKRLLGREEQRQADYDDMYEGDLPDNWGDID